MKNKKVFYIIMIVILGIFLIGNSIFIISSLRIKDDSKEIETNEEENEEQDEFVASLYNYDTNISEDLIEVAKRFDSKYETSKLLNLNTLEKEITNFNDLDNELKLNLAIKANGEPTSINASTLTDYFQKNFKDKISIQNKDFNCHNLNPDDKNQYHCDYKYDKKTNTYTQNTEFGHGVEVTNEVYSKLIDASNQTINIL